MRIANKRALLGIALLLLAGASAAQSPRTEHTFKLDHDEERPEATLELVSWFAGSWSGEAFGNTFEEAWTAPTAGSMVGMFKLLQGDEIQFYELMLFVEEEGSLSFKVRHFNADFTAWEDKEQYVTMRFIQGDEHAVHFEGISFYRVGEDEVHAWLVFGQGETLREEKLVYRRR